MGTALDVGSAVAAGVGITVFASCVGVRAANVERLVGLMDGVAFPSPPVWIGRIDAVTSGLTGMGIAFPHAAIALINSSATAAPQTEARRRDLALRTIFLSLPARLTMLPAYAIEDGHY